MSLLRSKGNFPSHQNLNRCAHPPPKQSSAKPKVITSILDAVGNTPLLKINKLDKIVKDLEGIGKCVKINCNVYVKLEYLNPGGSIKDRVGKSLMNEAIKANVLTKDRYLIEPTSGNTGIALAMSNAVHDLDAGMLIVTKDKCSEEKLNTMQLLGAHICLIQNHESEIGVVDNTINHNPDKVVVMDQFANQVNPQTHYQQTAMEIYDDLGQKWPDMVAMVAGSGGTFTGICSKLKKESPSSVVVLGEAEEDPSCVEGIVINEVPLNLDMSLADMVFKVSDKESFLTAKNLARYEGVLCGGSAGMAMAAAMYAIANNKVINTSGKNVVVILPDGIRNYMTKFVLDQWMEAHLFQQIPDSKEEWYNYKITDDPDNVFWKVLKQNDNHIDMDHTTTVDDAIKTLICRNNELTIIITDKKEGRILGLNPMVGLASANSIRYHMTHPRKLPKDFIEQLEQFQNAPPTVHDYMEKEVYVLKVNTGQELPVGLVARMLDITQYVVFGYEHPDPKDSHQTHFIGKHVGTAKDVLAFIKIIKSNP